MHLLISLEACRHLLLLFFTHLSIAFMFFSVPLSFSLSLLKIEKNIISLNFIMSALSPHTHTHKGRKTTAAVLFSRTLSIDSNFPLFSVSILDEINSLFFSSKYFYVSTHEMHRRPHRKSVWKLRKKMMFIFKSCLCCFCLVESEMKILRDA